MPQFAICTNKGPVKTVNQDACCTASAHTSVGEVSLAAVCDGVGGLSLGELASSTAIRGLISWFEEELPKLLDSMRGVFDVGMVKASWQDLLLNLNKELRTYGTSHGLLLGTTFTGLFRCDETFLIAHAGDSRAYRIRGGRIDQLTQDQTLAAHMLACGRITPEEAAMSPHNNVILQSVGTSEHLCPDFCSGTLKVGDVIFLCSDGAYRTAKEEDLARMSCVDRDKGYGLKEACDSIVQNALRAGEKDNVTSVCYLHKSPAAPDCNGHICDWATPALSRVSALRPLQQIGSAHE